MQFSLCCNRSDELALKKRHIHDNKRQFHGYFRRFHGSICFFLKTKRPTAKTISDALKTALTSSLTHANTASHTPLTTK